MITLKSSSAENVLRKSAKTSWDLFDGSLIHEPNFLSLVFKKSFQPPSLPFMPLRCTNFTISTSTYTREKRMNSMD